MQETMDGSNELKVNKVLGKFNKLYIERLLGVCEDMCDLGYI